MKIIHFKLPISSGNTLVLDTGCIGMKCVGFVEGLGYEATQLIQYSLPLCYKIKTKTFFESCGNCPIVVSTCCFMDKN